MGCGVGSTAARMRGFVPPFCMSVLLRELIHLPEHVHRGDFVLKLTEGVQRATETLENYVVTPQLADAFDQALGLIRAATENGTSKACYLHGSFGAGKSHFMAVLLLLLEQNAEARSKEGLEAVVARHNAWTQGRRFLMVPYNVLGANSLEEAILAVTWTTLPAVTQKRPCRGFTGPTPCSPTRDACAG